jgi:hypothetical protein
VSTTWTDGTQETGYMIIRWSPVEGIAFFPQNLVPYPANAAGFQDNSSLVDEAYCYLIVPVGGKPPRIMSLLGFGDFLCFYPNTSSANAPGNFRVRLDEGNIATLEWDAAAGGVTGYQLTVTKFDGSGPETLTLNAGQTSTTYNTQRKSACFQLRAMAGATTLGTSARLCGVPGIASIGAAGAPQALSTGNPAAVPTQLSQRLESAGSALRGR